MKNYLMFALILCAIPAVAVAQTVTCDDCTHVASVYMGEGGVIAMADDDADMVSWVATCGGVTRHGELKANDDGVVATLWTGDLACMDKDGGSFEIGPVMDGGWFWITDETNSAVGGLVSSDVLKNKPVGITSAGDGVKMMPGKGAVYLKETATGRVGILPNILPEPPMKAATKCGFSGSFTGAKPGVPVDSGCMLGDGKTQVLATTTDGFSGNTRRIMDKAMITRPKGTGSIKVLADLWGNGSGHYVATHAAANANGISAGRGQPALGMSAARAGTRLQGITYVVTRGVSGPGSGFTVSDTNDSESSGDEQDGLARTAGGGDAVTVTITSDSDYCSKDNNHSATVTIAAVMAAATSADQVVPTIVKANGKAVADGDTVASTSFTVVCPSASASANMGTELVPENPFPVDE